MGLKDSKSNTYHGDGSTTTHGFLVDGHLVVANAGDSEEVISKAGKSDDSTASATGTHLLAKVGSEEILLLDPDKGRHGQSQSRDPYRDDGSTSIGAIISVIKSKTGKGETYQTTDGSTASEAVLGCDRMDRSTTTILVDSQGKAQRASMESLPADIVQDILSRVPAESVLECKLVCKKWVTLIGGSNFANMHLRCQLNHLYDNDGETDNLASKVDPSLFFACRTNDPDEFITLLFHGRHLSDRLSTDEKYIYNQNLRRICHPPMHNELLHNQLVGSCNGLLCAYQHHHLIIDPIYICNPLTWEYVNLPQLVVRRQDVDLELFGIQGGQVNMHSNTTCGFGYVSSTNEYKVVRVYYLGCLEGNAEVYTLGSGCGWRAVGKISDRLDSMNRGTGTYANDVIYWTSNKKVVALDLATEEFQFLPVPHYVFRRGDQRGLVALGGHLCLYVDDKLHVKIWSLTKSGDPKETWRMEFDIDYEAIVGTHRRKLQPILLRKNREVILLFAKSVLYSYDPKTTVLKMISNVASTDNFEVVEAFAHVNTFASLETMGEKSKRYTVRTPLDEVIGEFDRVALSEGIHTRRFKFGHND